MVLMLFPATAFAEEPTGSLAVTIDGFEVGKILGDCTLSFETTNLGVTFGESDILGVQWWNYDPYAEDFYPVDDRNVFGTATVYRCTIELDSKGLTEVPAVTVNGKTPESCEIGTSGGKAVLRITCELGTAPAPALVINGLYLICAQQDYAFTVTAAEGAVVSYLEYRLGDYSANITWDSTEGGVYEGTVLASEYRGANNLELTVYGTAANGKPLTETKTVAIANDHFYGWNGVCLCGAVRQYTITYDGGEESEGSIAADVKTHGVDFTLSSETFRREGYIQNGWKDMFGIYEYDLGALYPFDRDMTFYPIWEALTTLTVPFTFTVELGDNGVPGETVFTLEIVDANAGEETYADVTVCAAVTTNGAGSYTGTMTLTGPYGQLRNMLCEGAFVQQVNGGADGWAYDDTVWGLLLTEVAAYATADDAAQEYTMLILPATCEETENGMRYELDANATPLNQMSFTNVYTAHDHAYTQKYNETDHWEECACGDEQNKEAHKYGEWTITKEATETEAGEKDRTCTVCGYQETAEMPKLPANPATGDSSNLVLWFALLALSAAGVIGAALYSKRGRSTQA